MVVGTNAPEADAVAAVRPNQSPPILRRFVAVCSLLSLVALPVVGAAAENIYHFEVDYAKRRAQQKSMIGMIHGADTREVPPDDYAVPPFFEFIEPLQFQIWESGGAMLRNNFVEMVHNTSPNARAFLRINGGDAEPDGCKYEGLPRRPYLDPEGYGTYVACVAAWARDNGIHALQVWNEPNLTTRFRGDFGAPETAMDRWHQTYHIAHNAIRSVWPEARISGPALAKATQGEWLAAFMDYLLENELTLDIIALHETQFDVEDFPPVADAMLAVRAEYIDDPRFASVGVEEIVVTESVYKTMNEIPATNLAMWYYFEKGDADAAARTCWNKIRDGTCFENTLNGLVTSPDENGLQHRTPAWWTTFHYNRTLKDRARITRDYEKLIGMANDRVVMLGSYHAPYDPVEGPLFVKMRLRNVDKLSWIVPGTRSFRIGLREIPRLPKGVPLDELPITHLEEVEIRTTDNGSKYVEFSFELMPHVVRVLELGI